MPHTPEPDDGLDSTAPPPPVFHVEQALLGALLLDPHRADGVSGITGDSFSTAAHAALYNAIITLPRPDPAAHARSTEWLDRVLATAREQTRGLTAAYVHALVQVCPRPSHARAYARMVEAEHARRRLRTAAGRLVRTVRDPSLPHPVPTALTEADALATVVDDIAHRFPPRAGVLPRTTTPPPVDREHAEAGEEEQLLLAAATAYPTGIDSVRWLLADDFTVPLHAGLWQCLTALALRQEPVDPVTVLWEAQQRGLLDNGSEPGEVLRMLAEPAGSIEHWSEHVLERALLAAAEHTGQRIEAYAGDPANTPFQLVIGARRALVDIAAVRTRWQHATGATSPQRRRPAPTTRAGPPTTRAAHAARATGATR
ncbi:DnaB-like helicase N-terminal domain-containing protein [Streptomyces sp. NPDC056084]|uniref:DnaB-like helicase N-terminal domain-containing protein n=1 Tax=unclassified Streptomyces TaxID=2593676 RepID=UPI0035D6BB14